MKNESSEDNVPVLEESYQLETEIDEMEDFLEEDDFEGPTRKKAFFKKLFRLKSSVFDIVVTVICKVMSSDIRCFRIISIFLPFWSFRVTFYAEQFIKRMVFF